MNVLLKLKMLGLAAALAGVVAAGAYFKGVYDGRSQIKNKALNESVSIREVQNEIRNHRPDAAAVAGRLRRGTF